MRYIHTIRQYTAPVHDFKHTCYQWPEVITIKTRNKWLSKWVKMCETAWVYLDIKPTNVTVSHIRLSIMWCWQMKYSPQSITHWNIFWHTETHWHPCVNNGLSLKLIRSKGGNTDQASIPTKQPLRQCVSVECNMQGGRIIQTINCELASKSPSERLTSDYEKHKPGIKINDWQAQGSKSGLYLSNSGKNLRCLQVLKYLQQNSRRGLKNWYCGAITPDLSPETQKSNEIPGSH